MVERFTKYCNLLVITIILICWCEVCTVNARLRAGAGEELEFWHTEKPTEENFRRAEADKRNTEQSKYPRGFEPDLKDNGTNHSFDPEREVLNLFETSITCSTCPSGYIWTKDTFDKIKADSKFKDRLLRSRFMIMSKGTKQEKSSQVQAGQLQKHPKKIPQLVRKGKTVKKAASQINRTMETVNSKKNTTKLAEHDQKHDGTLGNRKNYKSKVIVDEFLNPYATLRQMRRILKPFPNVIVSHEILGRTVEYNDIILFKISEMDNSSAKFRSGDSKYVDEAPGKMIIFIVHGLTVMGISHLSCLIEEEKLKILIGYYLSFLDKFDIYFIPIANPDGYAYAYGNNMSPQSLSMLWNKNRSQQKDCKGVMLDRNFDISWNFSHQMSSCSHQYPGPEPFSEPETRAVRDVFHFHGHKIIAYIHVHAGTYDATVFKGDAVLYPRGFTDAPADDDKYIDLKGEIDEMMTNASFQAVSVSMDSLFNWYGKVSGSSVDYASTVYGIPFSMEFVMQLYDDGDASTDEEKATHSALTQIWKRVINVVFGYIARTVLGHDSKW